MANANQDECMYGDLFDDDHRLVSLANIQPSWYMSAARSHQLGSKPANNSASFSIAVHRFNLSLSFSWTMSAEKYEKLISELPTTRHQEPALTPIRRRSYRRIVAKCAVASVASIWLFSHYHENRGSWLQGHNGHHGIRGKEAEELFL